MTQREASARKLAERFPDAILLGRIMLDKTIDQGRRFEAGRSLAAAGFDLTVIRETVEILDRAQQ